MYAVAYTNVEEIDYQMSQIYLIIYRKARNAL